MRYTDSHEWIQVEGEIGTVGVSEYAQKELGDIVYVELPQLGKPVRRGEEAAVLESTKAAADVYSPASGIIVEVNQKLKDVSELVNQSPENEGWLFKISLTSPQELGELMTQEQYKKKFV